MDGVHSRPYYHAVSNSFLRRIRILIVDDHRVVRQELVHMLRALSWLEVVGEAPDGRTAVDMALELQPDVVIMDVNLPVLRGTEATKEIVSRSPGVRVIGFSIFPVEEWADEMREAGAVACLSKGGSSRELIASISASAPDTNGK